MNFKKKAWKLASLAIGTMLMGSMLAGCGDQAASSDEIVIGSNFELTGNQANYGNACNEGLKLAIKEGDTSYLDQLPSAFDMLVGQTGGSLGEVSALCLLIGCCFMLWKKIITWHIPVSILATVFVLAGLFHLIDPSYANPVQVILSGGLMLGACFMATDYVTSPMTAKGQLIYGCAIGVLTVLIRDFGSYPEGMSFAILIMNGFTPLINTYIKPKRFGEVKK